MKHARRLALPAALAATAALTAACGSASSGGTAAPTNTGSPSMSSDSQPASSGMAGMAGMAGSTDTGTAASAGGYTLRLTTTTAKPNTPTTVAFTISGPDAMPVTDYTTDQTKKLHLYLIRTDLTGFQHLHPTMTADGVWSIRTTFPEPGAYRVVADFTPRTGATPTTRVLGAPLTVAGRWQPRPTPPVTTSTTVDGYTVTAAGTLTAAADSPMRIRITRGGNTVTNLQPYLGVWAHLSAFHAGSLALAHMHPTQQPMSGMTMDSPDPLSFQADLPAAGIYRVYVQFQTDGVLHTAALTLAAH